MNGPQRPFSARRPDTNAAATPSQDPVGAFLLRQRAEVVGGSPRPVEPTYGEKVTDLGEIARILAGCLPEEGEDDLVVELLLLESMLAGQDLKSDELLEELGMLGDDVRAGLVPPHVINVAQLRQRTQRLRQHLGGVASRVSAALLMFLTSLPFFQGSAQAAQKEGAGSYAIASAPVIRAVDANSSQPIPGVQIKTMEERLLGTTDATGQVTLGDGYMETDLLSLEKDGYEMYLLDRTQVSSRNIVTMKPLKATGAGLAAAPTAPERPMAAAPVKPAGGAVVKPPVPPKGPEAPVVARAEHGMPHVAAPKAPTKPGAPTIRLPVRPRAKAADVHARTHADPIVTAPKATAAHGSDLATLTASPEVHLPVRPKLPAAAHEAQSPVVASGGAPDTEMALPEAPSTHRPAPTAAHEHVMSSPARPRVPAMRHAAAHAATPAETPYVAIPHRVPRPRMGNHGTGSYYRVKPGDSLSLIARKMLGSSARWPEVYAMNRGNVVNPRFIRVGQTLALPEHDAPMAGSSRYVVKPGDCLFTIAHSQLGAGVKWRSIWAMNRGHIRDARRIFPGQVLNLPMA